MEADTVSVEMTQPSVPEQPVTQVQEEPATVEDTSMANAQYVTDPNLGQNVDILD